MFRVGLTGNVASGKSVVARAWSELGAIVVDADALARRAVEPGSPALERIRQAFGDEVLQGGELDRAGLRRKVFADEEARRRLESIVHPEVARLREREEARLRERGVEVVVHEIPLLFEVGLEGEFDMVVLVDAPAEVRAQRLARDRGLSAEEIHDLMRAQMPAAAKRGRADLVIQNQGSPAELEAAAERAWREVVRRAESRGGGAGLLRVDMHVHTRASFDCRSDPEAVVERAVAVGLSLVCITDHNEIEAALSLHARHPARVIVGEEVKTAEGVDLVGLYLSERIPRGTPARETCEQIHAQGGLVYVPHPFAGGKGGGGRILPEIEDQVDVVEGFNARLHDQALNQRALEWAGARDLPTGGGSDAHTLAEVGRAYAEVPAFNNEPRAFLAALRRGTVHGRESSRLVHIASTIAKVLS